jgi:hypothetical protein
MSTAAFDVGKALCRRDSRRRAGPASCPGQANGRTVGYCAGEWSVLLVGGFCCHRDRPVGPEIRVEGELDEVGEQLGEQLGIAGDDFA